MKWQAPEKNIVKKIARYNLNLLQILCMNFELKDNFKTCLHFLNTPKKNKLDTYRLVSIEYSVWFLIRTKLNFWKRYRLCIELIFAISHSKTYAFFLIFNKSLNYFINKL